MEPKRALMPKTMPISAIPVSIRPNTMVRISRGWPDQCQRHQGKSAGQNCECAPFGHRSNNSGLQLTVENVYPGLIRRAVVLCLLRGGRAQIGCRQRPALG